jgi:sugar lactone lactonase YvrE
VGIALDKNRNVYVAGKGTNNVVVVSPGGKICREIMPPSSHSSLVRYPLIYIDVSILRSIYR